MTEDEFRKQDNTEPAFSGYEQGESLSPIDKLIAERDALVDALKVADEFINACLKFGIADATGCIDFDECANQTLEQIRKITK